MDNSSKCGANKMKKKSYNLDQALRRVERLETAVQSSHRTLKAIAENPNCSMNHIRAGTAMQNIAELYDEIQTKPILIGW